MMSTTYTRALRAAEARFFAAPVPAPTITVALTEAQIDLLRGLLDEALYLGDLPPAPLSADQAETAAELEPLLFDASAAIFAARRPA